MLEPAFSDEGKGRKEGRRGGGGVREGLDCRFGWGGKGGFKLSGEGDGEGGKREVREGRPGR